ncbi:hypothetical protein [Sphingobacterium deserti]|uniref:Fibrobacter succinogenes major paralogous domain-containing protein n=1 Tax=Sphingobacterium deserti TaxID=1229276 RepID=A0A0B8T8R9_9SPHI|nr:hypothetical protein [Sphingobacterium deserti]KGE14345.1 hypothetical protein DI53_1959 [Sphingobacterium deserti]
MTTTNLSTSIKLMLCIGLACTLFSCTKGTTNETNEDATLAVTINGLEDYILDETPIELTSKNGGAGASSTTANRLGAQSTPAADGKEHELYFSDDFDIDFEIVKSYPASATAQDRKDGKNDLSMSTRPSRMVSRPITTGVRCRILIYRENETTPIVNVEAVGSTFPPVAIASGFNYRWIAVSTNETTSSPTVANNVVSAAQIANKDFLYAAGTIFTQFGQNNLNVVLRRYTSRTLLTLDTRGMFGTIAANSNLSFTIGSGGTLSETADFNVRDSSFSNYQASALSSNNMTSTTAGVSVGALYTVRPRAVAAGSLQLRLNPLILTLDDGSTRTFTNTTINFGSAFSPVRGSSYAVTARLIESGVRVGTSPIRWARSNLTYLSSAPSGFQYRFRPHPVNYAFSANVDLWNFATTTPTGTTFNNVDVCSGVYPAGTWRLPTPEEYQALGLPNSLEGYTPLLLGGSGIVANWNRSSTQPANPAYAGMDQLRLGFYGYRTPAGALLQQPLLVAVLLGGQGHYSTSSYTGEATNPAGIRPTYFRMSYTGVNLVGLVNVLDGYSQAVVQNEIGSSFTQGRSIRCVRTVNPAI